MPLRGRVVELGGRRDIQGTWDHVGDLLHGVVLSFCFDYSRIMEHKNATHALAALGHATRLSIFRLLVQAGRGGRLPGEIAADLGLPGATLSFHLKELTHAELVSQERQGRNVLYRAAFPAMNGLLAYLTENCCQGAVCAPADTTSCNC